MSKVSFTTMATPGLGAVGSIRAASRYGFDGVDLRVSDYLGEISPVPAPRDISEISSVYKSEGILVSGLLCYNEYGGKDEGSWTKMRESLLRHIEIASLLGSPTIRVFGGNPGVFRIRSDFICRTAEVINEVLSIAGCKVRILVQNHHNSFSSAEISELVNMVAGTGVGMVYSPDHSLIYGEDMLMTASRLKSIIHQLYMADIIRCGNDYTGILPGKGILPLSEIYHVLGGPSYDGWVTFKWEKLWNRTLDGYKTALPFFMDYFKSI